MSGGRGTSHLTESEMSLRNSFHQEFGNIFDDDMIESSNNNNIQDGDIEYFCVFCEERGFKDKDDAKRHYQHHLEYHPVICSLCGFKALDIQDFLDHHTSSHPDAEKGRYKRREVAHIDKWISAFLYTQTNLIKTFPPREHCLVCEKVFSQDEITAARPRRCTINRKIDHIHRHLCYLPYECIKCKEQEGKEFLVGYFESKAHSHIKLKHPDVDDAESRWFIFQKTRTIPKLDDFIANYLIQFGISTEVERRPISKKSSNSSGISSMEGNLTSESGKGFFPFHEIGGESYDDGSSSSDLGLPPVTETSVKHEHTQQEALNLATISVSVSPSMVEREPQPPVVRFSDGREVRGFFCPLCPETFSISEDIVSHLGHHFNYSPIRCLLCSSNFSDMNHLSQHHRQEHSSFDDLKFEVLEDFAIERYVDNFVQFQLSPDVSQLTLDCTCRHFCPVCTHCRREESPLEISRSALCRIHDDVFFGDHLKQHFNYTPYVCTLCRRNGREVRLPNLNSAAIAHVIQQHSPLDQQTVLQIRSFPKVMPLPSLEQVILHNSHQRQLLYAQADAQVQAQVIQPPPAHQNHRPVPQPFNRNCVISPEERQLLLLQQRNVQLQLRQEQLLRNSPSRQQMQWIQQQRQQAARPPRGNNFSKMRVICEKGRFILRALDKKKPTPISKNHPSQPKTNHIRVQGGRVVNLSTFSHNKQQRKPQPQETRSLLSRRHHSYNQSQPPPLINCSGRLNHNSHNRNTTDNPHHQLSMLLNRASALDLTGSRNNSELLQPPPLSMSQWQSLIQQSHNIRNSSFTTSPSVTWIKCTQCNESFPSRRHLRLHAMQFHPTSLMEGVFSQNRT